MTRDEVRIGLSWGLIAAAIVHALMFAGFYLVARTATQSTPACGPDGCGEQAVLPLPRGDVQAYSPEKFAEPPAVNYAAQSELKQQCPPSVACPTPQRVASNPYNLAPGEKLVPGSVRWSDSKPTFRPRTPSTPPSTPYIIPDGLAVPHVSPPVFSPPIVITPVSNPTQAPGRQQPAKSYQVLLFLDDSSQAANLKAWWDNDRELLALRAKSSYQVYTPDNALYRTRFAQVVPASQFPAVLVQDATGGHIHAAGKSMIPGTPAELVSDIRAGWELYKQAKQGVMQQTGAIKTTGYSWDDAINPAMRLNAEPCGPDGCPPEDNGRWYPGKNIDLFDRDGAARNPIEALIWANAFDLATIGVFGLAALLLIFVLARRS